METKCSIINLVQQQIWGIIPDWLDVIHNILYARYFGGGIDIGKLEAAMGRKLDNKFEINIRSVYPAYVRDKKLEDKYLYNHKESKIALIPVHGAIAKRMNLFHEISGGVSTELLRKSIDEAINSPEIDAIVLDVESPGGTVDGTKEIADFIYESRGKKPIIAHANGLMASAAYWISSAVDRITAYDTAQVGSIGVITAHYDYSKQDEMKGVKRTYLYSGKYKAMGNDTEPLSKEAKNYIQKQLDDIYTMFVESVAMHRGKDVKHVLSHMADGRIFLAKDALEAGLIDDIMNLEQTIQLAAEMADGKDGEAEIRKVALALNDDPILNIEKISYEEVCALSGG